MKQCNACDRWLDLETGFYRTGKNNAYYRNKCKKCYNKKKTKQKPRGRSPSVGIRGHYQNCIYDDDKTEFLIAVDNFKRETRTKFPSWTEIFDIVLSLGYEK